MRLTNWLPYLKADARICLLRRAKTHLSIKCGKMIYNVLVKPIQEYCCTVWGKVLCRKPPNALETTETVCEINFGCHIGDSSVKLFDKLGWLPIDDIVRVRNLFVLHKVSQNLCPEYFMSILHMVIELDVPPITTFWHLSVKETSGLGTFHLSACRLWNKLGHSYRDIYVSHTMFKKHFRISSPTTTPR